MILTATGYGLGTLWIANTCFAYNELIEFIGTDNQLTGIVAVGAANEAPPKRPRKALRDVEMCIRDSHRTDSDQNTIKKET